jgi:NDP-sugar pyrophosphorylase family protein
VTLHAGIIAAGEGSRLARDGYRVAKPLVPVAGVPLVERAAKNLLAAGAASLTVIFNETEGDCADYLRRALEGVELTILMKTTPSSLASLREILAVMPPGPALVSTVDAFCAPADLAAFAGEARRRGGTVLAVTPLVADEKPLWVKRAADGRIVELGGTEGDCVTAGVYLFGEEIRRLDPPADLPRLRDVLRWLVIRGEALYGVAISEVVDVDRAEDVELAEALALRMGRETKR